MNALGIMFEKHMLFRRLVVLLEIGLLIYVTEATIQYVLFATELGVDAGGIIGTATVIQAPYVLLLGYTFKIYSGTRNATDTDVTTSPSDEAPVDMGGDPLDSGDGFIRHVPERAARRKR